MAYIIRPDGTTKPLSDTSLKSLQEAVGGYIEPISLRDGSVMFVNEEGKLRDLPDNEKATKMANLDVRIVGTVVICGAEEVE